MAVGDMGGAGGPGAAPASGLFGPAAHPRAGLGRSGTRRRGRGHDLGGRQRGVLKKVCDAQQLLALLGRKRVGAPWALCMRAAVPDFWTGAPAPQGTSPRGSARGRPPRGPPRLGRSLRRARWLRGDPGRLSCVLFPPDRLGFFSGPEGPRLRPAPSPCASRARRCAGAARGAGGRVWRASLSDCERSQSLARSQAQRQRSICSG